MPRLKGLGIRRAIPFSLRLNARERAKLESLATAAELSMVEFARCKIFDIPLEMVGGKSPRARAKATSEQDPTIPTA